MDQSPAMNGYFDPSELSPPVQAENASRVILCSLFVFSNFHFKLSLFDLDHQVFTSTRLVTLEGDMESFCFGDCLRAVIRYVTSLNSSKGLEMKF